VVGIVNTTTIGSKTIAATATDNVGRTTHASIQVTVRYDTCGLTIKADKSGLTTVTMKVCDASGGNLSGAGLLVVASSLSGPGGSVPLVAPNGPAFTYVAKSRSYQLVISTAGLAKGSYSLGVRIGTDAAAYPLGFRLK
jgi:hypothetical protein